MDDQTPVQAPEPQRQPLPWLGAALATGPGRYPLVAVLLLAVTMFAPVLTLSALRFDIAGTLGTAPSSVSNTVALQVLLAAVLIPGFGVVCHRRPRRGAISAGTALAAGAGLLLAAFAGGRGVTQLLAVTGGALLATTLSVQPSLLVDLYQGAARVRVVFLHLAGVIAGGGLAVAVTTAVVAGGLTWRSALLALAPLPLVAGLVAHRLRDPGPGGVETDEVEEVELGFVESTRRALTVTALRSALGPFIVLGMFLLPLPATLLSLLDIGWRLAPAARGFAFAAVLLVAAPLVIALGGGVEARLAESPGTMLAGPARLFTAGVLALAIGAVLPWPAAGLPLIVIGVVGAAVIFAAALAGVLAAVQPAVRLHANVLLALAALVAGGAAGALLLLSVSAQYGPGPAVASLAVPGLLAGRSLRRLGGLIGQDVDRRVRDATAPAVVATGPAPLLACRGIDFSYGQVQVLFDVDFTVDDGEMVALLGTNGAGKSTLLRVISGLGLPSGGTVAFQGRDVTYLDAVRRLPLGIAQVPGGKAVFGPLTVVENLRLYGYTLAGDRKAVDRGIEATFEAFPRLAERRNQPAGTMSGGEQQMLALGKAFMLRPRLLLIDELSLGLAPKIVGELLAMVRRINAQGTAVVLVEQSVNVALSLVQHAYFMERGEIRFDGEAASLLQQPELLRSVFLEGAAQVLR